MQFNDKTPSEFDEVSRSNDSSNPSSLFQIDLTSFARGQLGGADTQDFYQLDLANGDYTVYVTTDGLNVPDISNAAFTVSLVNSEGTTVAPASSAHVDNYTDQISFELAGSGEVYLKISSNLPTSFSYNSAIYADVLDETPPTVTIVSPDDGASQVAVNSSLVFSFSEVVQAGFGAIVIREDAVNGSIFASINANTAILQFAQTLIVHPPGNFEADTTYFVSIAPGAFGDLAGNPFAGLTGYSFTTANTPPTLASTQSIGAIANIPVEIVVDASDPDGDPLTYELTEPANGTLTGSSGTYLYTPDTGFLGEDSFTVTVSDEDGSSVQTVNLSVGQIPTEVDFRLFSSAGFAGEVGGGGSVFGTAGFNEVSVQDLPGRIGFDPSFNAGGDIVRLPGNASQWHILRTGSSATLTDGDTFVQLPVGTAGTAVVFDDGVRTVKFDAGLGSFLIGDQAFATTLEPISAEPDETVLPDDGDENAVGRLFVASDASVSAGGRIAVFGTNEAQEVTATRGDLQFDPSFNKGDDTLVIEADAATFTAVRQGSSVFLDSAEIDLLIPVGTAGMTIGFTGDDERELIFDAVAAGFRLGDQLIGLTPVALTDFA